MKKISILLLFVLAAYVITQAQLTSPYTVTSTGTGSWQVPDGTTSVTVECWGGGGAGGSIVTTGATNARSGGGAGGSYAKKTFTNLTPGQTYSFYVGAGGVAILPSAPAGNSAAAAGTSTTFNSTDVVAVGGTGGNNNYDITTAAASTAAGTNIGDVTYLGGNGGNGASTGSGGGGGSAGSGSVGGNASNKTAGTAGTGVNPGAAGGAGVDPGNAASLVGNNGNAPGAGGGGAATKGAIASKLGGNGGAGKIIISWIGSTPVAPTIGFSSPSVAKNYGDAAFTNICSSNSIGTITYSSNNTAVATIDVNSGQVTITGVGTATITANQAAAGAYLSGSATFTLTVSSVITVTTPSPASLNYQAGGTSGEATFSVSGSGLTNDVLLAPGTNVEVSLTTGSGFVGNPSSLTVPLASFSGGSVTVYIRLRSGIQPGGTGGTSRTVTITSTNAATKTTALSNSYITGVQINNTGTTSTYALGASPVGPWSSKSFTVMGAGLETTTQVLLTVGSNLEVTTDTTNIAFASLASPTTLSITAGTLPGPTIASTKYYYRLKSGLATGVYADATTKVTLEANGSSSLTGAFTTKEFQVTGSVTIAPTISFALATIKKINGDATFTQTATSNSAGAITYSSGSTGVATVDPATGAVTIVGVGSAVITATQAANGYYSSSTTTYTVTVVAADVNVSNTQNIGDLAIPGSGSVSVGDGGVLNINQNTSSVTMSASPLGKITLSENTTLTSTFITLQSNAGGTATFVDLNNTSPQTVTGTVQQYLTAERNWYTSSPITAGTAAGLSRGTSVQTYSEASKSWTVLAGSDALVNGKGYVSVATTGFGTTGTVSFNGTLNSGTIEVPVTRTEAGSSRGFNLVANPYPSYLDWSLVTADGANSNIGTTMWFRTKTGGNAYTFSTYNSVGNVAVDNSANTTISKFIPPMQAFWIRVNSGTASTNLTFKNSMRAHKDVSGNTFKAPKQNNQQLLRLQISNGTYSDEAVVYFNTNASNAFDTYDSQKMFEIASAVKPEIYTQTGTEQLVINGLNTIPYNTEIPLGLVTKQAGNFSIAANELLNFESGTRVILKDKLNPAIETELTPETAYNFSAPITAASTDRFSLIFRAPGVATGTNNIGNVKTQVFVNAANQIAIIAPEKATYSIFNAVGQLSAKGTINHSPFTINHSKGVYVVRVNNQSTRVIVK